MAENCQNDNLLIGYQFLVFIKISRAKDVSFCCSYDHDIHYFEDATTLKGLNFAALGKIAILCTKEKLAIPVI